MEFSECAWQKDPTFDFESYYDQPIKNTIYEAVIQHSIARNRDDIILEDLRVEGIKNRNDSKYKDFKYSPSRNSFNSPMDLTFVSQFPKGKPNFSYKTVLEFGNESGKVEIFIISVRLKYDFSKNLTTRPVKRFNMLT